MSRRLSLYVFEFVQEAKRAHLMAIGDLETRQDSIMIRSDKPGQWGKIVQFNVNIGGRTIKGKQNKEIDGA